MACFHAFIHFIDIIYFVLHVGVPDSPKFTFTSISLSCVGDSRVALQWSSPMTMKEIQFYTLDVTGFTCSPDECQVNSTNTTISGLMDNTSYTITVRAVNCIGEGNYSQPLRIDVPPILCG